MKTVETTLTTTAIYSDDCTRKYLIRKVWEEAKPSLAIILLAPSTTGGVALDNTTQRTICNADRLGFGSVSIVNLFSVMEELNGGSAVAEDSENMKIILTEAKKCDVLVYAPGNGKAKNQAFQARAAQVLKQLKPYEKKMKCLSNEDGTVRLRHPLFPAVQTWYLRETTIAEAMQTISEEQTPKSTKPTGKPKKAQ